MSSIPSLDLSDAKSPALRARLTVAPLTRFAPSPTGPLHIGHVVHAVHVWGVARALNGRVALRIEDHDRLRCHPKHEQDILDVLSWLQLVPDIPEAAAWDAPCDFRQSDCALVYNEAARRLEDRLYYCTCSRRALEERRGFRSAPGEELAYDGFCRERNVSEAAGVAWRVRLPRREVHFNDARLGPQVQRPFAESGDLLIRDRRGLWSYQFCVTVDDLRHGIDLVIRGEDILSSTGRQLLLRELLGEAKPPVFYHHALVRDDTGEKLGKSRFSQSVSELRKRSPVVEDLLGLAAVRAGWAPRGSQVSLADLLAAFRSVF